MNRIVPALIAIFAASCASPYKKWENVHPGQSMEELTETMGQPLESYVEDERFIHVWKMDDFAKCAALMSPQNRVVSKVCKDDSAARAQAAAAQARAAQMYMMMNSQRPAYQQTPTYQSPQKTNCVSRNVGGTVYTDCSSGGGIDTSIYR